MTATDLKLTAVVCGQHIGVRCDERGAVLIDIRPVGSDPYEGESLSGLTLDAIRAILAFAADAESLFAKLPAAR